MPCSPPHKLVPEVFAHVPAPGHPLGIVPNGDTLYVGTHRDVNGGPGVPSHIYAYNRYGNITHDYTIAGQATRGQGIAGLALDCDGVIYAVDQAPSRVIWLDPRTGDQGLYAELPDMPLCDDDSLPGEDCSAAATDRPPQPINLTFGPDGTLYVSDLTQALIWRVPAGGGTAHVWYTASDLDSLFGPNTAQFRDPAGRCLLFADSAHDLQDPAGLTKARGRLYTLEIEPDGTPGKRCLFWEGAEGETPDGFAIGRSGNVYVALAVANCLLVLDRYGAELTRVPATPQENADLDVPFNLPGGVTFWGSQLMVTNQVFLGGGSPAEHVIYSVPVCERGRHLFRPRINRQLTLSAAA